MYIEHPVFEKPEDENVKLWRYSDVAKLISLLDRDSLFFARIDLLEDKFEGALPHPNIAIRQEQLKPILDSGPQLSKFYQSQMKRELSREKAEMLARQGFEFVERHLSTENEALRRYTCVSCWYMNDEESSAMWKLYCQSNEAVAIQSTFARLVQSLTNFERDIYIGIVKYTDYERATIPAGNDFFRFMYKRKSFDHEREIRAVFREEPIVTRPDGSKDVDHSVNLFDGGISIPVDVRALIERIVAPSAPKWFHKVVEAIVRQFGFEIPVVASDLKRNPVF